MKRRLLLSSALVVALLVGGCSLWLWQAKRQYALNRQLIEALRNNDCKQAFILVNAGADPNTLMNPSPAPAFKLLLGQLRHRQPLRAGKSTTALIMACGNLMVLPPDGGSFLTNLPENAPLVEAMLARDADVHAQNGEGATALHYAAVLAHFHTAELLIRRGANVNAVDAKGRTPLFWTVSAENPNMIRLLMAHGADPNLCNRLGESALMLAQREQRSDIVALLRKGAK